MATPCEQIATIGSHAQNLSALEQRVVALERWEGTQNGSLLRIEGKVDQLHDRVDDKVEGLRNWLLAAVLSCALSLMAAVFQLLRPH